ncbi:MBL fold metallo-hydrolase [Paenibacillus sp. BK720]|uniref:MBL fold metallo-hydrolase n=1 Tax=Paenibacillus sp. BK720 TaxID=2587092 RepID=UPI001ABA5C23|nr:MBL fold metallo-hydrolase [Paenibacillus sp. BK720]NIK71939.1 glyoxylase-like metal-dependent hydrolase (beta-lactamase superfamily II) [Paenibacillus sp. BK720]
MSNLQFAELSVKRDSLTRNLPEANEELQWVSNTAILIYGEKDAVLVDTFITIEHNHKLLDWIKSINRNLKYIYITHGHGDHFFGIKQIKEAFPYVKAIATEGTVKESYKQGSLIESFWDKRFPNQIPEPQVFPDVIDTNFFELEGNRLEIIESGFTDTANTTSLWIPDLELLVAGDVVYNGIHPYLAETTKSTRLEWIQTIDRLKRLNPKFVIPGHKVPDNDNNPKILDETKQYLLDFIRLDNETDTALDLFHAMLHLYPNLVNPGSLWGSANAAKA